MKNIYKKVNELRNEISNIKLNKTGYNPHSKHKFFELEDFLGHTKSICYKLNVSTKFDIVGDEAILTVFDIDSGESLEFKTLYKNTTNIKDEIQSLGSSMAYLRRYLYVDLLELIENDVVDNTDYITNNQNSATVGKETHTHKQDTQNGNTSYRQQPNKDFEVKWWSGEGQISQFEHFMVGDIQYKAMKNKTSGELFGLAVDESITGNDKFYKFE